MGSRIHWFVGPWVHAAMDAAIISRIGFKGSRVEGFIGSWVHGLMSSRVHGFKDSLVCGFMGSLVQGFKGLTCTSVDCLFSNGCL